MGQDPTTQKNLLDPAIRGSIRALIESEVGGVAAAECAERHARNARERAIWAALRELEEQTRLAVFDHLGEAAEHFDTTARLARVVGPASGAAVAVLPHGLQMRSLVLATRPFMRHFRKLDAYFATSVHGGFFGYVLAHEIAIAEFGRRALAHDDNALAPVEALIGAAPK